MGNFYYSHHLLVTNTLFFFKHTLLPSGAYVGAKQLYQIENLFVKNAAENKTLTNIFLGFARRLNYTELVQEILYLPKAALGET